MADRPIIFSAPMVRAILAGEKSQTRRIVRRGPLESDVDRWTPSPDGWVPFADFSEEPTERQVGRAIPCPYGGRGDRLWVRETWQSAPTADDGSTRVAYRADDSAGVVDAKGVIRAVPSSWAGHDPGRWRPSIFMPRWASRITLEVVSVRIERLNDISPDDAADEGLFNTATFARLWDTINGKGFV